MPAPRSAQRWLIAASNTQRVVRTPSAVTASSVSRFTSSRACITPLARKFLCGFTLLSVPSASPSGVPLSHTPFAPTTGLQAVRLATSEHLTTGSTSISLMLLLARLRFRAPFQQLSPSVCRYLPSSTTCPVSASDWSPLTYLAWRYRSPWSFFFVSPIVRQRTPH